MHLLVEFSLFVEKVRSFFKNKGYTEVVTPILQEYPNIDPYVEPIQVRLNWCGKEKLLWLHTSPEPAMKKLLSYSPRDIFQITKVFRNKECGKRHLYEFTMLEFYKLNADYQDLIREIGELLFYLGISKDYEVLRLEHAFEEYAGVILSEDEEVFKNNLLAYGYEFDDKEGWEDLFFRIYVEVERHLGIEKPTFITHFPSRLSAYAKVREGYAERFELYIKGIEIANGWTEETDKQEIEKRMRSYLQGRELPLDEELLKAYESFPNCAGCSVGLERLFMAYKGLESLDGLYL